MQTELRLPINLGLNDGTICPQSCVDVMLQHNSRTSLRNYTTSTNAPLLKVICEQDGVQPENIYVANGSGPLLKQCIPWIIEKAIRSSAQNTAKHLFKKIGIGSGSFPIVTGRLTYFKVPLKALKAGLDVELLPLGPETNWKLRLEDVEKFISKKPGLVYICNPNNPTGQLMLTREEIIVLLDKYPDSVFWVDEAYVQYIAKTEHQPLSDLVTKYNNLYVSRTFSFAYGLAGARIGYLLGPVESIKAFEGAVTDYRLGTLQEALAIAALTDPTHLQDLEEMTRKDRDMVGAVLEQYGIEVVPSKTHFILGKFNDGTRTGKWLTSELLKKQIKIKSMEDVKDQTFPEYFRITLGVGAENEYLCACLHEILKSS
jgi:histidinol-phosphate aminotransferase